MTEKLQIIKTKKRKQKWRELRDKLEEHDMKEGTISGRLDKAVELALRFLQIKRKKLDRIKQEFQV